jgi:hypothetical protein
MDPRYAFMKSGFGAGSEAPGSVDFMRKVVSLLKVLYKEAAETAARFASCCGRVTVTERDVLLALKYEAHEFLSKPIDAAFLEGYSEEQRHSYETESEEDDSGDYSGDSDAEQGAEAEEAFSSAYVTGDRAFYDAVLAYDATWDEWDPDDPVLRFMKTSIDKANEQCGVVPK